MRSEKAGLSNLAVARATGKTWDQWLEILDGAGAKRLSHKETAQWISANYPVGGWWAQMVTVGYERMRGLRTIHQRLDGYCATVTRTVAAPQSAVWPALRNLGKGYSLKSTTEGKALRLTGKGASVEIRIASKGEGKSQISVEHNQLKSEAEVQEMRQYWTARLTDLKQKLEVLGAGKN